MLCAEDLEIIFVICLLQRPAPLPTFQTVLNGSCGTKGTLLVFLLIHVMALLHCHSARSMFGPPSQLVVQLSSSGILTPISPLRWTHSLVLSGYHHTLSRVVR